MACCLGTMCCLVFTPEFAGEMMLHDDAAVGYCAADTCFSPVSYMYILLTPTCTNDMYAASVEMHGPLLSFQIQEYSSTCRLPCNAKRKLHMAIAGFTALKPHRLVMRRPLSDVQMKVLQQLGLVT